MLHCPKCATQGKIVALNCEKIGGKWITGSTTYHALYDLIPNSEESECLTGGYSDHFLVYYKFTCPDCGIKLFHRETTSVEQKDIQEAFRTSQGKDD